MFVPTTKCVIPIWLKLLCKHRKPHWPKYDSRLFLLFHFFYERHGKKTIFGKHLTFRSFHCFSREMKWKSLSQLWQIAVQSALNLEIYHCFPLRPFFSQVPHFPQNHVNISHPCQSKSYLPCFDSRFNWAVIGQPAGVAGGETAMSQGRQKLPPCAFVWLLSTVNL